MTGFTSALSSCKFASIRCLYQDIVFHRVRSEIVLRWKISCEMPDDAQVDAAISYFLLKQVVEKKLKCLGWRRLFGIALP